MVGPTTLPCQELESRVDMTISYIKALFEMSYSSFTSKGGSRNNHQLFVAAVANQLSALRTQQQVNAMQAQLVQAHAAADMQT